MLWEYFHKKLNDKKMKYLFVFILGLVCLSGCTSVENLSNADHPKDSVKSNRITVFTPNGIVYMNDGF
jgi:hypothetical protein